MRKQIRDDQLLKSDSRNRGCMGFLAILFLLLFIGLLLYNNFIDVIIKNDPINDESIDATEENDFLLNDDSTDDTVEDLNENIDDTIKSMPRELDEVEDEATQESKLKPIQEDFKTQNKILSFAEVGPEYPGGLKALRSEVYKNYDIPRQLQRSGQGGQLVTRFVVEKDGSVSNVQILRGIEECDACSIEAIEALNSLDHKFSPAMQDGEPVRIWFTFPINLVIN